MKLTLIIMSTFVLLPLSSMAFCLQTFNAYGPIYAPSLKQRTQLLNTALKQESPCEIIHFQEVWNPDHQNELEKILLNVYPDHQTINPSKNDRIGLISSLALKVESTTTQIFRINKSGLLDEIRDLASVKKAFTVIETVIDHQPFLIINTHLHPTSTEVRIAQIVQIMHYRIAHPDKILILSGDLNIAPFEIEHVLLRDGFGMTDAQFEVRKTYDGICSYCSKNPRSWMWEDKVFDYVFYQKNRNTKMTFNAIKADINLRGTNEMPLSDHYGLRIDFDWQPTTAPTQAQDIIAYAKSLSAINQAIEMLKNDPKKFEVPLGILKTWYKELENKNPHSNFVKIWNNYY